MNHVNNNPILDIETLPPKAGRLNPLTITLELIPESQANALLQVTRSIPVSELLKLVPNVDPDDLMKAWDDLAFSLQRDLRDMREHLGGL